MADEAGGNTANDRVGFYVLRDYGTCSYYGTFAYGDTRQNHGSRANEGVVADGNSLQDPGEAGGLDIVLGREDTNLLRDGDIVPNAKGAARVQPATLIDGAVNADEQPTWCVKSGVHEDGTSLANLCLHHKTVEEEANEVERYMCNDVIYKIESSIEPNSAQEKVQRGNFLECVVRVAVSLTLMNSRR